jgi:SAM-dependent methyltransferase
MRFPYDDDTFQFCALISVFTHMYAVDIRHYMDEIKRVLKTGGTCVATFFIFNDDRMDAVTSSGSALPMKYQLSEVSRYFNENNVLHAISYDETYVVGLWTKSGFVVTDMKWGTWAGDQPSSSGSSGVPDLYQDVFIVHAREA